MRSLAHYLRAYAERDGRGYPDWAARYAPIVAGLRQRVDLSSARILEIGANANGLARFANTPIIAADISIKNLTEARAARPITPVAADIASLPFADGSFDVCVCVDTYEHLPASSRAVASREILRVLRPTGVAVVAFPSGKPAEQAEQIIRDAYRALTSAPLSWLEEHASEGLPDADEIARVFAEAGGGAFSVTCTKNATLWVWRWMWRVLMCNWPGRGNALFQAALRLSTPVVCRMHFGTCYRAVVWIQCKNGSR